MKVCFDDRHGFMAVFFLASWGWSVRMARVVPESDKRQSKALNYREIRPISQIGKV